MKRVATRASLMVLTVGLGLTSTGRPAEAQAAALGVVDANTILAEVDRRAAVFSDQSYDATMEIRKGNEVRKSLEFRMVIKDLRKQLIEFVAPGDVAGMKVLMPDPETLYVYMPEFQKVRRVAAHARNQGFMGGTFTYEDMVQVRLSPYFNAVLDSRSGDKTVLKLTPKQEGSSSFSHLLVTIDKEAGGVTQVQYFEQGKLVREQRRLNWNVVGGHAIPTQVEMENKKTGDVTVIKMRNIKVNQGVEDGLFSRRTLLR